MSLYDRSTLLRCTLDPGCWYVALAHFVSSWKGFPYLDLKDPRSITAYHNVVLHTSKLWRAMGVDSVRRPSPTLRTTRCYVLSLGYRRRHHRRLLVRRSLPIHITISRTIHQSCHLPPSIKLITAKVLYNFRHTVDLCDACIDIHTLLQAFELRIPFRHTFGRVCQCILCVNLRD